jgi:DNA-binding transcriptional MerR regulator
MLTIGQLATHAGVTVRAVRHYHAQGLLAEPRRDTSGYRCYDATAVVDLIRIRTLAEAGVPLSRVKELLVADADEFAAAIAEIDRRLGAEIREQQARRRRIRRLAAGDNLALPPEAVVYLDRLRELGLPERFVEGERDAWTVVAARSPELVSRWVALKHQELEDPEVVDLYRRLSGAIDWRPDDPRLPELADWLADLFSHDDGGWEEADADAVVAAGFVDLLDSMFVEQVPVARRLMQLLEERGWTGWTHQQPTRAAGRQQAGRSSAPRCSGDDSGRSPEESGQSLPVRHQGLEPRTR